jgi:invasion protein IalB
MFRRPFLRRFYLIAAAFSALSAFVFPSAAQQAKPKDKAAAASKEASPKADAWLMRCDNAGKEFECSLSQTIVMQKTGQRLLSVVVRKPPKGEGTALMLHLPYGLHFPSGVTVQVDAGKVETLQVQTCDEKGCYAGAPIAAERLSAMQSGEKLVVGFKDLKQQAVNVPVPLAGFAEAYKKAP